MPGMELRFRSVALRLGSPARDNPCAMLRHRAPERQSCPTTVVPAVTLRWEVCGIRQRRHCCTTRLAEFDPIRSCASPARRTAVVWTAALVAVSAPLGAGAASRAPSELVHSGRRGSVPAAPTPGLHARGAATDRTGVGRGASRPGASTGSVATPLHSCPWMPRFSPA